MFEPWAENADLFEEVHLREGWFHIAYHGRGESSSESEYVYGIEDEDSKININLVSRTVLTALPGIDAEIADCIIDWRDADDRTEQYGAERDYYESKNLPYSTANRPFNCLEELLMVRGINSDLVNSLKPFITVYGDSAVNVLTAPLEVLAAIGLPGELIAKIDDFRSNGDRIEKLLEEEQPDADRFVKMMGREEGLSHGEILVLTSFFSGGLLKFHSSIFRIRCEGVVPLSGTGPEMRSVSTILEVVYAREKGEDGNTPFRGYLYWREE